MIARTIEDFSSFVKIMMPNKKIQVISHFDTDGITSAAIFSKALERLSIQFSVKIIKQLTEEEINLFPDDRLIFLLDLGSGSIKNLSKSKSDIFIIDHHEINEKVFSENLHILNTHLLYEYENLCSAELTYLVARKLSEENKDLAHLSVLGMVGDIMDKEITKTRNQIIQEGNVNIKKGILLYPSTRPLDKILEFSSRPYIPGVTGDPKGTFDLLKEAGIEKTGKTFKSLIDLSDEEMKRLVTAIMLRFDDSEYDPFF